MDNQPETTEKKESCGDIPRALDILTEGLTGMEKEAACWCCDAATACRPEAPAAITSEPDGRESGSPIGSQILDAAKRVEVVTAMLAELRGRLEL